MRIEVPTCTSIRMAMRVSVAHVALVRVVRLEAERHDPGASRQRFGPQAAVQPGQQRRRRVRAVAVVDVQEVIVPAF